MFTVKVTISHSFRFLSERVGIVPLQDRNYLCFYKSASFHQHLLTAIPQWRASYHKYTFLGKLTLLFMMMLLSELPKLLLLCLTTKLAAIVNAGQCCQFTNPLKEFDVF